MTIPKIGNLKPSAKFLAMTQKEFEKMGGCGIGLHNSIVITNKLNVPKTVWHNSRTIAELDAICYGRVSRGHCYYIEVEQTYGVTKFDSLIA